MADKLIVTSIRPDVNSIRTRGTFELVAEALDRLDGNVARTAGWINEMETGVSAGPPGPAGPPGSSGGASGKISYEP